MFRLSLASSLTGFTYESALMVDTRDLNTICHPLTILLDERDGIIDSEIRLTKPRFALVKKWQVTWCGNKIPEVGLKILDLAILQKKPVNTNEEPLFLLIPEKMIPAWYILLY
ncbi:MAG: hypothetical protein K9M11_01370 [Candidatus Pacebacteria bacterium]|nr:hypothetical protein [Candidatus Paceibacterota bacterium]